MRKQIVSKYICVSHTVLSTLHVFTSFFLITTCEIDYMHLPFTDKESSQIVAMTFPGKLVG
jgi:hypothetical protein